MSADKQRFDGRPPDAQHTDRVRSDAEQDGELPFVMAVTTQVSAVVAEAKPVAPDRPNIVELDGGAFRGRDAATASDTPFRTGESPDPNIAGPATATRQSFALAKLVTVRERLAHLREIDGAALRPL